MRKPYTMARNSELMKFYRVAGYITSNRPQNPPIGIYQNDPPMILAGRK